MYMYIYMHEPPRATQCAHEPPTSRHQLAMVLFCIHGCKRNAFFAWIQGSNGCTIQEAISFSMKIVESPCVIVLIISCQNLEIINQANGSVPRPIPIAAPGVVLYHCRHRKARLAPPAASAVPSMSDLLITKRGCKVSCVIMYICSCNVVVFMCK